MQRPSSVQLCDRWLIMQREIRRTAIQLCYIAVFSGTCILFARSNPTCLQNVADAFSILYSAQVSRQYSMDRSNIINLPLEWYLQVSQWSKKSLPSDGEIIFLRISLLTALHGLRNIINTSLIRQEGVFFWCCSFVDYLFSIPFEVLAVLWKHYAISNTSWCAITIR